MASNVFMHWFYKLGVTFVLKRDLRPRLPLGTKNTVVCEELTSALKMTISEKSE